MLSFILDSGVGANMLDFVRVKVFIMTFLGLITFVLSYRKGSIPLKVLEFQLHI